MKLAKILIAVLTMTIAVGSTTVFAAGSEDSGDKKEQSSVSISDSINNSFSGMGTSGLGDSSGSGNSLGQSSPETASDNSLDSIGFGFSNSGLNFSQNTLNAFDRSNFMKAFNSFDDFSNKTAFTLSNFQSSLGVEQLNSRFASMSLNMQEMGFGQINTLNYENKLSSPQSVMNAFTNSFGGLSYDSINTGSGNDATEGKMQDVVGLAAAARNEAYSSADYQKYQSIKNNTSISHVYDNIVAGATGNNANNTATKKSGRTKEQLESDLNNSWIDKNGNDTRKASKENTNKTFEQQKTKNDLDNRAQYEQTLNKVDQIHSLYMRDGQFNIDSAQWAYKNNFGVFGS